MKKKRMIRKIGLRKRARGGFTLIEMTIAIALFAIVILGILMLMSQSLALGQFSETRMIAMNETRQVLEAMRNQVQTNGLSGITANTTWATNGLTGVLDNESVTVSYPQGTSPDPLPIQITLNWTEKGRAAAYTVDTLVTQR